MRGCGGVGGTHMLSRDVRPPLNASAPHTATPYTAHTVLYTIHATSKTLLGRNTSSNVVATLRPLMPSCYQRMGSTQYTVQ